MQSYELNDIINNIPYIDKNEWERFRYTIYSNIQMNCKKKLKPTDIIKYNWDIVEKENNNISNEDIKRLQEKANKIYGK